jgi:Flagellar motor switch protein FliM
MAMMEMPSSELSTSRRGNHGSSSGLIMILYLPWQTGYLGGDGSEQPRCEQRSLSNIELRLAEKAFDLVGKALQSGFATVCETTFRLDRIETRLDFVAIAPRTAFGVKVKIKVRILGREIGIFILIPQTALNSVSQELERDPSSEMSIHDPRWSKTVAGRDRPDRSNCPRGNRRAAPNIRRYCRTACWSITNSAGKRKNEGQHRVQRGAALFL